MRIFAIDPGCEQSAFVLYDGQVREFGIIPNNLMIEKIVCDFGPDTAVVIEQVASMGMAVGEEVFETVFWSGRFAEARSGQGYTFGRLKRHEIKMHLCFNARAKDANIRQRLIDKFGPGKDKAIGRKASPGPLYGISKDCWQALAVAVCWHELHERKCEAV